MATSQGSWKQFRVKVRRNGRTAAMHLHHYFRFRDDQIVYRGSEDSAQTVAVLQD